MAGGIVAKKSLGQNFLHAPSVIRKMLDVASIKRDDLVVEIGPGKGALTKELLERGAQVFAFELDERMISFLQEKFSQAIQKGKLILIHQDILKTRMHDFFSQDEKYKLVANIPYYISNMILRKFLSEEEIPPQEMVLLVQHELAERIVARDGKSSLLSLSVAAYADAQYIQKVSRRYFRPVPKVDSAVIALKNISQKHFASRDEEKVFFQVIRAAFRHKRKKLMKNLSEFLDQVSLENIFAELGFDENIRAEELSVEDYLRIVDKIIKKRAK